MTFQISRFTNSEWINLTLQRKRCINGDHRTSVFWRSLQKSREWNSNPRPTLYESVALPLSYPCFFMLKGQNFYSLAKGKIACNVQLIFNEDAAKVSVYCLLLCYSFIKCAGLLFCQSQGIEDGQPGFIPQPCDRKQWLRNRYDPIDPFD